MNGNLDRRFASFLGCVALITATSAQARDWTGMAAAPFADPLYILPGRLDMRSDDPAFSHVPIGVPCDADAGMAAHSMKQLTLVRAVDVALCLNPQIRSTWAAMKLQAAAVGEARAPYLPSLTASGSRMHDRINNPDGPAHETKIGSSTAFATLSWRLFDFGGRSANLRAANALLDAAMAHYDASLQKSMSATIGAYFEAQTALAAWQARQQIEEMAELTFAAAQRRQTGGAGAQSDTLQAATALAKARLEKSRARGNYHKAVSVLVYNVGAPANAEVTLAADLEDSEANVRQDLQSWIELAQASHPALMAARAELLATRQKLAATKAEGLPSLDFSASYYRNGRPNQGLTSNKSRESLVGITLNIPLFDGFARTYKVRGMQAQVEQREAELADTEHQLLMEVVKAHADATSALENLEASAAWIDSARSAVESVQRKFDRGLSDMTEVLNTQAALSDAQQQRIQCQAEWRSARLRLLAIAGVLNRWMLG